MLRYIRSDFSDREGFLLAEGPIQVSPHTYHQVANELIRLAGQIMQIYQEVDDADPLPRCLHCALPILCEDDSVTFGGGFVHSTNCLTAIVDDFEAYA